MVIIIGTKLQKVNEYVDGNGDTLEMFVHMRTKIRLVDAELIGREVNHAVC